MVVGVCVVVVVAVVVGRCASTVVVAVCVVVVVAVVVGRGASGLEGVNSYE